MAAFFHALGSASSRERSSGPQWDTAATPRFLVALASHRRLALPRDDSLLSERIGPPRYFAMLIFRCITTVLRLSKELSVLVSLLWPWYSARSW
jgi:hypothetical protein